MTGDFQLSPEAACNEIFKPYVIKKEVYDLYDLSYNEKEELIVEEEEEIIQPIEPVITVKESIEQEMLSCTMCDYTTTSKNALRGHVQTHVGRRFQCEYCDYSSTRSSDYKRHSYLHTGEKPFKCDKCSFAHTRSTSLKKHKEKYHMD